MPAGTGGDDSAGASGDANQHGAGNHGHGGAASEEPRYRVVQCPAGWKATAATECDRSGSSNLGIRIRATVLGPGVVYRDGELWIDAQGSIGCVGCDCASDVVAGALTLSCPDGVLSPGLLNPHDHIGYSGTPPLAHDELYEHRHDWRLGLRGHMALAYEGSASRVEILAHELRMVMSGVTATVSAGGERGLLRNLDDSRLSEGLRAGRVRSEPFPLGDASGLLAASGCDYAAPDDRDYTAQFAGYLPHVAEGIDGPANNELACASGVFGILQRNTAVVHALASDASDAAALRSAGASVVWSPRSNIALYGNTAPVTLLRRAGVPLSLGTDWLASGSMNLQRELACARSLNVTLFASELSEYDLWKMVTFNAALAAGQERALGRLQRGYAGDIALFRANQNLEFGSVIAAEPADVRLVLRGGAPLYGDAPLIESFATAAACEKITVCGAAKRACVFGETGIGLAELQASADLVYPLFACDAPPGEPSCVPARDGEYGGVPSDGDRDGDGRSDGLDLCPDIFDAVRPFDGGRQADLDGDGRGDACDDCPLAPDDACDPISADDADGDGIDDIVDNCPRRENADQTDGDGDGHGDDCDPCATPNPGAIPCRLALPALRGSAESLLQSPVEIAGVYVTALRPNSGSSRGFYVQDASLLPYSGLFVYAGAQAPGVTVGERVTVLGYFDRFAGQDELIEPLTFVESGEAPLPFAPILVTPSEISDGGGLAAAYTAMLVRVEAVVVEVENPDAPSDYDEFAVSSALRIDDWLFPELDNTYAAGQAFIAISGIQGFSFGHHKLWPRAVQDLER